MNSPNSTSEDSTNRAYLARRRIWWGLVALAFLVSVGAAVIVFEAVTGQLSGTVVQVRIDECSPRKLTVTGFCRPGSTYQFRGDEVPEDSIELRPPSMTAPLFASLRVYLWKQPFRPSSGVPVFGKQGPVVYYVKTGDVISLRLDETATLMSWETDRTTQRWAIVTHADR